MTETMTSSIAGGPGAMPRNELGSKTNCAATRGSLKTRPVR